MKSNKMNLPELSTNVYKFSEELIKINQNLTKS